MTTRSVHGRRRVELLSIDNGIATDGTKNPAFYVAAGLRHKSDFAGGPGVPSAFRSMYNELAVRGVLINEAIFDGGGELGGTPCLAMYADLGIAPRPRVSEVNVDAAEIAHRRIYEGVRPALAAAKAPENLWELCAQDFIAKTNCAASKHGSAHGILFGTRPDVYSATALPLRGSRDP